jgi:excisionase family DNA binding protein
MAKDRCVSPNAAARRLGISVDYLYKLLWAGKLQGQKINERWRVPLAAIEDRLKQREERGALASYSRLGNRSLGAKT